MLPLWTTRIYTLLAVMFGWVWFRATDFPHALSMFKAMLGFNEYQTISVNMHLALYPVTITALISGIFLAILPDHREHHRKLASHLLPCNRVMIPIMDTIIIAFLFIASLLAVGSGAYNPFLYFRF